MALDPSISLQGRGVDIKPYDPVATLVTVAQLKNMQSQEQLRQLQMAQLGNQLGEYQRIQGPLADIRALNQGEGAAAGAATGMVSGAQLGTLPPSAGPITQTPMGATPAPSPYTNGPPADAGHGGTPNMTPMSPQEAAAFQQSTNNILQGNFQNAPMTPQEVAAFEQAKAGILHPTPMGAAVGPPPGGMPAPAPPGSPSTPRAGMQSVPPIEELMKLVQSYRKLGATGPMGATMAQHMMDLQSKEFEMRKGLLELHAESIKRAGEIFAGVTDEAGYQEARRLTATLAPQEAAAMPPTFDDPRAKAWLAYRQATAQTQQQRVQADLDASKQRIDAFGQVTQRMKEEREGRKVTPVQTAGGIQLQRETPLPGTTGTTPMLGPQGQALLPPEYGKQKEFYDAYGHMHLGTEMVPQGQQPRVQRPLMPPASPVPGYAAGTPNAPPQLMNQAAVQSNLQVGRDVQKTQLDAAIPLAETARNSLNTLAQMKTLMHQGYYDDLFAKDLAGADAMKAQEALGRDPQKLANTFQIQNLAAQLVTDAEGNPGLRGRQTEISKLKGTTGRLDTIPPKMAALQTVEQFRQLFGKDLERYNTLIQSPNTPQLRQMPLAQTLPKTEFDKRYMALKAVNPQLTKDDLALRYERAGVHVEGAY